MIYSQLPEVLGVKGKEAKWFSLKRLSRVPSGIVEPPVDNLRGVLRMHAYPPRINSHLICKEVLSLRI
jgi:hypothetical protein